MNQPQMPKCKQMKTEPEDKEMCLSSYHHISRSCTILKGFPRCVTTGSKLSPERIDGDQTAHLKINNREDNTTQLKTDPVEYFDDFLQNFVKQSSVESQIINTTDSDVLLLSECEKLRGKRVCRTLTYTSKKIPAGESTNLSGYIEKSKHDADDRTSGSDDNKSHKTKHKHFCRFCKRGYVHKCHLSVHMKTHTGERQYCCQECGAAFFHNDHLQSHRRIHSEIRPFTCGECGQTFRRSGNLREHQRRHTGERPHQCTECGKTFLSVRDLRRHRMIHTGVKPFTCTECGNSFLRPATLQKHMRIHTGERPFYCSHCGKTFPYAHSYNCHIKTHQRSHST